MNEDGATCREAVVLTIAGTDPLGGAGCAADLATIHAFGLPGCAIETAWVAQNSTGVEAFVASGASIFQKRLHAVFSDCHVGAIKLGMLASRDLIECIAEALSSLEKVPPIVLDPVGAAGGANPNALYSGSFDDAFDVLFPFVTLLTPNQRELWALTGEYAQSHEEAQRAADILHARGVKAVLLKGGHLKPVGLDRLSVAEDQTYEVYRGRPWSVDIHGTGCHLSSAIACGLARGLDIRESSYQASRWLHTLVAQRAYHTLGCGRPQFDARRLDEGFGA